MRKLTVLALVVALSPLSIHAAAAPSIADKTKDMRHLDGFLPLDWDEQTGRLYLEIPKLDSDMIYVDSLPYGTGSNDLSLDRGQIGDGRLVRFERVGQKVLLVQPNVAFRSGSTTAAEALAVRQSFPESVLWGFTVEAETNGAVLIDATNFLLSDVHGVINRLAQAKQGTYHLDATRSVIAIDDSRAFPMNTELEAKLTFAIDSTADAKFVKDVAPDAHAMTLHERVSFVALPKDGYTPRRFDPRSGYFSADYRDYTAPLGGALDQKLLVRHRLEKKDPACKNACEAVTPIQYYVDRGAPEPIRTALVEGARWWDEAFQASGWAKGTFRVDLLPENADPIDVRYNIIQWVHRYTRGWSYGSAVIDPRTGEIIKGNVTLGSLRGRQDYLIAEALLSPYKNGTVPSNDPMLAMVLARLRQLAAHETGHTLGLVHNFAASSFGQSTSVMDYPHPNIQLGKDGAVDLTHAYAIGIGAWDKVAITYGYRQFAPRTDEQQELSRILEEAQKQNLPFLSDDDARPAGSASPIAHLWDNGPDATAELNRILEVRKAALAHFGEDAIRKGTPMAQLEQTLVPLYLLHRYQTEATIKLIGGLRYEYNLRGDGQPAPSIVPLKDQDAALTSVLKTLEPDTLTLPESLLKILPPVPPDYPRTKESFPSETGLTFDPIAAAESAADLTLNVLFDPARASRLLQYHMRDTADGNKGPSLRVMMEKVSKTTAERTESGHTISSEVMRAVEFRGLEAMLSLAVNADAASQARAIARYHVEDLLKQWTSEAPPADSAEAIHRLAMIERINEFNRNPDKFVPAKSITTPPGMPIGDEEEM
ncbi:zinc-dependent metalloprotease [Terriglobus sp. TAA 43]|uniref:zinc-dependent metalloprotease n=1 Tax=Terriglobus sp. TAA 43 TaxID=278961 RepID=UPI000646530C|nr:zinc-dependent metalloprotease [Terriglobus sp. TAA 43]